MSDHSNDFEMFPLEGPNHAIDVPRPKDRYSALMRKAAWFVFALISFSTVGLFFAVLHLPSLHLVNDPPLRNVDLDSTQAMNATSAGTLLGHYVYNVPPALVKRRSGPIITTGAPLINGSVPLRLEIRQLQQKSDQWTLYLLALDWLQFQPQTDELSWYGINGIHGRPYRAFDNVGPSPGNENTGYCTHVSEIFTTWHRPYLALFEQEVVSLAQTIASLYTDPAKRQRYVNAASSLRLPYWEWAALPTNDTVFPSSVGGSPAVKIDGPSGPQVIHNPLYGYFFQPLNTTDLPDAPLKFWSQTLRSPSTQDTNAASNDADVTQLFQTYYSSLQSRVFNLLTNPVYSNFSLFGNEGYLESNSIDALDSIEAIHDTVHGLSGAGGHMTYIQYSSWDPLFMLHHANIDRLLAMWQILYPEAYVQPVPAQYSTFTNSAGEIQDVNTELSPFRQSANSLWTSATVRKLSVFNYDYADTVKSDHLNMTALQARVRSRINSLYGTQASTVSLAKHGVSKSARTRLSANVVAYKDGLQGPYSVRVYLHGNEVAFNFINSQIGATSKTLISASVPLSGLATENDVSTLVSELTFRVSTPAGHTISSAIANSIVNVTLISSTLSPTGESESFPIWSKAIEHGRVAVARLVEAE